MIGVYNANTLKIKTIKINSKKVKRNYKFVQLTDVHIDTVKNNHLPKIIEKVNKINPDYLLITGDLLDIRDVPMEVIEPFKKVKAPIYSS